MPQQKENSKAICVFCGSSPGASEGYTKLADDLGKEIAKRDLGLVYGGGGTGLMGSTARAVRDSGAHVLGVIPDFLMTAERALDSVETLVVKNMHERKMMMYERSSAFVVLPGGIGTIEEAVEMMSWMRLQLHQKPIVFLSENDYWSPLMALIEHTIRERFSPDWMLDDIFHADSAVSALDMIETEWNGPQRDLKPVMPISQA